MIQQAIAKPYRVIFSDGHAVNLTAYGVREAVEQATIEHPGAAVARVDPDAPLQAGQLFVSLQGYARMMGWSIECARGHLAELEAAGLKRHGRHNGSRFRISEILELHDKLASKG